MCRRINHVRIKNTIEVVATEEADMITRIFRSAIVAMSAALILLGLSSAHAVDCAHCVLTAGSSAQSSAADHRGQGLRRANEIAGQHGSQGRDNARQKQDAYRPGGSGVPAPQSTQTPPPVPLEQGRLDPQVTAPTCSLC